MIILYDKALIEDATLASDISLVMQDLSIPSYIVLNSKITSNDLKGIMSQFEFKGCNSKCTETDQGNDFYLYGEMKVINNGKTFLYKDFCIDNKKLNEYSCISATIDDSCKEGCNLDVQYECSGGCKDGVCLKVNLEPEENEPLEIPTDKIKDNNEIKEVKSSFVCSGCESNNKCYPFGYRKGGEYCSDGDNLFITQKSAEISCENNFECKSNVCVSEKCVSPSLIEKILNWFRRLFGNQ